MKRCVGLFVALLSCVLLAYPQTANLTAPSGTASHPPQEISWPRYEDEAVRLLQEYLRINTSNPPGNELQAAEFFHRLFDQAGIANTIYTYAPGRANIYAIIKGDDAKPPLILLSHMDTVRADAGGWKAAPFSGEILDGEIFGRGALDMKDLGLLHAMTMLIVARERIPMHRDLIFLATADEEVNDTGSDWMILNHPELLKNAEFLLTEGGPAFAYPSGKVLYEIGVAEKAPFWVRMTAKGRGGHGSVPVADSAPDRLVRAMHKVVNWDTPIRLLPFVEQYFHHIADIEDEPRASKFRDIRNSVNDEAFVHSLIGDRRYAPMLRDTVSLTVLEAGEQTNTIPATASCNLDVRLLPGGTPEAFLAQLRRVINDDQIELQPILTRFRPPNSSPTDSLIYQVMEDVVHRHDAKALVTPFMNNGFTESQMYRELGIASYGFNPLPLPVDVQATKHGTNERIAVTQLKYGLRVLYEVVARVTQ